jgi:2-polyprenyl-3-methyl-5-hydroxy-6-metoxy-1,4-benzoquinol methylase
MNMGKYLHSLLLEVCTDVIGVDSNIAGLTAMKDLGFDSKTLITNHELDNLEGAFAFALIPDVIEHIHNVGDFLLNIKKLNVSHFVFSTPNGLSLGNRLSLNSESVNSDHISCFTPYTLTKSLAVAGYKIQSIYLVDLFWKRRPFRSLLLKRFPLLREHLVVVASKEK